MGHIIFLFLHLIAFIFGFVFLLITVPLHLIYTCVRSNAKEQKRIRAKVERNLD